MAVALKLMVTGMCTVFFILIMVVILGNLIIRITNRLAVSPNAQAPGENANKNEISPSKLAAIVSAVNIASKGKGTITSIEKLN